MHLLGREVSLPIGPNTAFISKGQTLILIESEVTLLIKPDTAFIRKGSVIANRARH